jgi:hypothetical protein
LDEELGLGLASAASAVSQAVLIIARQESNCPKAAPHFLCNSWSFFLLEKSEDKSVQPERRTLKQRQL